MFQALDPTPASGGWILRSHAGRIAQDREPTAPWGSTRLPPCSSSVCPPLPARLDCALTPLAPAGLRENKLHLSQPQFTECQLQICDTWPLRNQLSFLMPGWDHKWDMISSVAKLSWSQRQHRAAHCCPSFAPTQTSALVLCHELL